MNKKIALSLLFAAMVTTAGRSYAMDAEPDDSGTDEAAQTTLDSSVVASATAAQPQAAPMPAAASARPRSRSKESDGSGRGRRSVADLTASFEDRDGSRSPEAGARGRSRKRLSPGAARDEELDQLAGRTADAEAITTALRVLKVTSPGGTEHELTVGGDDASRTFIERFGHADTGLPVRFGGTHDGDDLTLAHFDAPAAGAPGVDADAIVLSIQRAGVLATAAAAVGGAAVKFGPGLLEALGRKNG